MLVKKDHRLATLCIPFLTLLFVLAGFGNGVCQQPTFWEKAFFYQDIFQFVGEPYPSESFENIKIVQQSFTSRCDRLNRVILAFSVDKKIPSGLLGFNLYSYDPEQKLAFSTQIDPNKWPSPYKIGTHHLNGILHPIWIPPQSQSKNKLFEWELFVKEEKDYSGLALYLSDTSNRQLQPVKLNEKIKNNSFAAFYSYCQYQYTWENISPEIGKRLWSQKLFLLFFFSILFTLGILIRKHRSSE